MYMSYTFLTVCTWFQNMSTPSETSYTFLTVSTWFQPMSTHLETSYTFLSVCTWFQTMSSPLEMFYTCQNMVQNVYGFPLYDTIFGVIFRPVTNRPHQVGCQTDWFPNQNHYGCHILSRNKQKQLWLGYAIFTQVRHFLQLSTLFCHCPHFSHQHLVAIVTS